MSAGNDLKTLIRTARRLAGLVAQAEALVEEAREVRGPVLEAARVMHSDLLRTKHAVEDELVAWILDCQRCGLRVHWVVGEGGRVGHWSHAEPAAGHRPILTR